MSSFIELKEILLSFTEFSDQDFELEDNYCSITDPEGNVIHIHYAPDGDKITVLGAVGKLPEDTEYENIVLKVFMSMNFMGYETDGAVFALSDGNYIVLQRKYDSEFLSKEDFSNFIYSFADELRVWIDRYQSIIEQIEGGESSLGIDFS